MILSDVSNALDDRPFMDALVETRHMASTTTVKSNKGTVDAVELAKKWGIGLNTARKTIDITTPKVIRSAIHPISRCFRTKQAQLNYNRLDTTMYSDTMFAPIKSLAGNTCGQLFINDNYFGEFIPMTSKGEAGNALDQTFQDLGVPNHIHTDGAKELNLGKWKDVREKYSGIKQTNTEPNRNKRTQEAC